MDTNELPMWVFAGGTALAVVAGLLATRIRGEWLRSTPRAHIAASALIALFGWQVLVSLPGSIQAFLATVAGIPNAPGVADQQAFIAASIAFPIAAVLAVMGILQRRPWAAVLGIGLAAARVAMSVASTIGLLSYAESFAPDQMAWLVADTIALNVIPPLAAIGLLLWPLRRGPAADALPVQAAWGGEPSPEAGR